MTEVKNESDIFCYRYSAKIITRGTFFFNVLKMFVDLTMKEEAEIAKKGPIIPFNGKKCQFHFLHISLYEYECE